jgi:DNA replication initiation complex subunit (GINS family)
MLTYEDIYESLRKEKYSEQLQQLPKNFLEEFSEYLKEKQVIANKSNDIFSEIIIKTKKQIENSVSILREVLLRRKKKILNMAFVSAETGISKRDVENMLNFEQNLFEAVVKVLEETEKQQNKIISGVKEEELKNELIRFVSDTDQLMDYDGNAIGPFKKGEIANLPKEITKILVEDKKAEMINI